MIDNLMIEWEAILQEQEEVLAQLAELLKQEKEAVITMDLPAITAIEKSKHEQLLQIQVLETSNRGMMQRITKHLGVPGILPIDKILLRVPKSAATARIEHLISCIKSLTQGVSELNESHRRFLAHSLANVEASLSLIAVATGSARAACYTASGAMTSDGRMSTTLTAMDHTV